MTESETYGSIDIITKDEKIINFKDIIPLTKEQCEELVSVAKTKTKSQWIKIGTKGHKLELKDFQKTKVLEEKNAIVADKTAEDLYKNNHIFFVNHANDRIAERVEDQQEEEIDKKPIEETTFFDLIKLIMQSQKVGEYAEWKGRRNLTYPLINTSGGFVKQPISFNIGVIKQIKVITVANNHVAKLRTSVMEQVKYKQSRQKK